jgi:toxin ParE2
MKSKAIDIHPLAIAEADDAFRYYRKIDKELAADLKIEIGRCFQAIETRPLTFQQHLLGTRRCVLRRFPYLVIFQARGTSWFVVAVAHEKREPAYWQKRLK